MEGVRGEYGSERDVSAMGIEGSKLRTGITATRTSHNREAHARVADSGVISREGSYESLCLCSSSASAQCPAMPLARVCDGGRRVGIVHDLGVCVRGTPRISDVIRPPGFYRSRLTSRLNRH